GLTLVDVGAGLAVAGEAGLARAAETSDRVLAGGVGAATGGAALALVDVGALLAVAAEAEVARATGAGQTARVRAASEARARGGARARIRRRRLDGRWRRAGSQRGQGDEPDERFHGASVAQPRREGQKFFQAS